MASDPRTIALLLERIGSAGEMSARKMFGDYGLYCDGVFIGVICDDELHLKPTDQGRAFAPDLEESPAYKGARPSPVVPADLWDEEDWMIELIQITKANVKPVKKRKPRAKKEPKGQE